MTGFAGFPAGKQPYTPLPDLFFTELLPSIDHLGELKVTLHVLWVLLQRKGGQRCVSGGELAADKRLVDGLGSPELPARAALRDALERAVARGTLLQVTTGTEADSQSWYFVNSESGRNAVDEVLAGKWSPVEGDQPVHLQAKRPNIFVLYEQNIGALTPIMAETLMEAEKTYPEDWIEDAFREAVKSNVRKWRYVESILEAWASEGRGNETSRRTDERDRRRFVESEYVDYIEH
jgi:DnaD/phage-associated family protein